MPDHFISIHLDAAHCSLTMCFKSLRLTLMVFDASLWPSRAKAKFSGLVLARAGNPTARMIKLRGVRTSSCG